MTRMAWLAAIGLAASRPCPCLCRVGSALSPTGRGLKQGPDSPRYYCGGALSGTTRSQPCGQVFTVG